MRGHKALLAAAAACACFAVHAADVAKGGSSVQSHSDGKGTTTYWGEGARYEITGPGLTVFFLQREDGAVVAPLVRIAYVGDNWINVRAVTITVGERTYGPYPDVFGKPARVEAGNGLVVETLVFNVDSDEKWQLLEGMAEASDLGRPVIAVFEADAPYGIELDRAAKRATGNVLKNIRELAVRSH
jgi:hypothetical protein